MTFFTEASALRCAPFSSTVQPSASGQPLKYMRVRAAVAPLLASVLVPFCDPTSCGCPLSWLVAGGDSFPADEPCCPVLGAWGTAAVSFFGAAGGLLGSTLAFGLG